MEPRLDEVPPPPSPHEVNVVKAGHSLIIESLESLNSLVENGLGKWTDSPLFPQAGVSLKSLESLSSLENL